MAIQNRNYFFTPTVNTERFLSQDEPTEQVMRDFADSVAFKTEVSDTATETQQGLVETATQAEFTAGTDNNANGYALYVRPSMIKAAIDAVVAFFQPQVDQNANNITTIQGDITNIQGDITDIQNQFGEEMPLGSMIMYPKATSPNTKWMLCEGQTLDNTLYPDLFALIGYDFGGAGVNFSLPDLRSKFIAGFNDSGAAEYQTIGQGAGADSVLLTEAQSGVAAHNHNVTVNEDPAGAHVHTITINNRTNPNPGGSEIASLKDYPKDDNGGVINIDGHEGGDVSAAPNHVHNVDVQLDPIAGSSAAEAHENRPAFVVFPHIIKVLN
jgi:microcystin-dependent protein